MYIPDSSISSSQSSSVTNPFEFGNSPSHQGAEVVLHNGLLMRECFHEELLLLREHFRVATLQVILNRTPKLLPAPNLETRRRWNRAPNVNTRAQVVPVSHVATGAASPPLGDSFDCSFASGQTPSVTSEVFDPTPTATSMTVASRASTLSPSLHHPTSFANFGSRLPRFSSYPVGLVVDSASRYLGAEAVRALLLWFLTDDGKAFSKEYSTARFLSDLRVRLEPSEAAIFMQNLRTTMLLVFRSVWHISNVSSFCLTYMVLFY